MSYSDPTYDLQQAQELVACSEYRIHRSAAIGASEIYMDEQDIVECVCGLQSSDFYKTMESRTRPGTFQDVYKPRFQGFAIYLKLQIMEGKKVAIISFKRDESA